MAEWSRLRAPLEESFEELCCQLASTTLDPRDGRYVRKGTPDSGVECVFRQTNGEEWGWQAKWFLTSPTPGQWKQLDDSFETALQAHPQLTRYVVCLPIDLPDSRRPGVKSAQQKWEASVAKWLRKAAESGRKLSIEFWGNSRLTELLSQPSTRGLEWYWFDRTVMTDGWFKKRTKQALVTAEDRLIPELNIFTDAKRAFAGFRRTSLYWNAAAGRLCDLRNHKPPCNTGDDEKVKKAIESLQTEHHALLSSFENYAAAGATGEHWAQVAASDRDGWLLQIQSIYDALHDAQEAYYDLRSAEIEKSDRKPSRLDRKPYDDELHSLQKFGGALSDFEAFLASIEQVAADAKAVLLVGEAGTGKTHLLCDLLREDHEANRVSLLFHGEQFSDGDPWNQMIGFVGLKCDRDEFLGALQAAAQASGSPATIYIDAINEGPGSRIWRSYLAAMEAEIGCWEWLRLCVSVRDQYRSQVAPREATKEYLVVEHSGFAGVVYEASAHFFRHFGLEPAGPLLEPEFDNPLFLMLLCRGLKDTGHNRLPLGLRGVSQVFQFLIDAVDQKLSRADRLDYSPSDKLTRRAVTKLAAAMAECGADRLPKKEAAAILDGVYPAQPYSRSLLRNLEAESIITVTPDWREEDGEEVRFTYQRFSDYQIVGHLLSKIDSNSLHAAFLSGGLLHRYVKEDADHWELAGQIEALAVLLPEKFGYELTALAPGADDYDDVHDAMISSLSWRAPSAVSDATKEFVVEHIPEENDEHGDRLLDAVVSIATIPEHQLNGDFLHGVLCDSAMPNRDAWWSTFLFRASGRQGSVDRLIDWAWKHSGQWNGGDEVASLAGTVLAWFLTCSHRKVRDGATKGLVRLFERRLHLLKPLLSKFAAIDDPYVSERLAAATFGAASRSSDTDSLADLAQYIYDSRFVENDPPRHFLERDYLRQTVEVALVRGIALKMDEKRLRPPYRSRWPEDKDIPSWEADCELRDRRYGDYIFSSYNDFAKHATDFNEWTARRIDGLPARTPEREFKEFQSLLTDRQQKAFRRLRAARTRHWNVIRETGFSDRERKAEKKFEEAKRSFLDLLRNGTAKRTRYEAFLSDYFYKPWDLHRERRINFHAARRWMSARVRSLGWTAQRFGEFDNDFRTDSDIYRTEESIAKKYCWIALAEMQAICADTFVSGQQWRENQPAMTGPWEVIYGRDIDPSMLLSRTRNQAFKNFTQTWWFDLPFKNWSHPDDDVEWVKRIDDIPTPSPLMEVTDPYGTQWITLDGYYEWEQPTTPGYRHWQLVTRNIWLKIAGYFIGNDDVDAFSKWVDAPAWTPSAMPESDRFSDVFLGELFWGTSYHYSAGERAEYGGWTMGTWDELPVPILKASGIYSKSHSPSDSTLEDEVAFRVPCQCLAESLSLSSGVEDGQWRDRDDSLVTFDPAIHEPGAPALLIRRDRLDSFLSANGLTLFWVVEGKRDRSGGKRPHDDYVGHTEFKGVYRYEEGVPKGKLTFETKLARGAS